MGKALAVDSPHWPGRFAMTRKFVFAALILLMMVLVTRAEASATASPTFDLVTSSNLAGATDAIYTLHFETPEQSPNLVGLSITIPEGYSIGQNFITSTANVVAMSAKATCPQISATATLVTTTTPLAFKFQTVLGAGGNVTVSEPTATSPGAFIISSGGLTAGTPGCSLDLTSMSGFFLNPLIPGNYTWAPSTVDPVSGSPIVMLPRPGYSQTVEIAGASATTTISTPSIPIPEYESTTLILLASLTIVLAIVSRRPRYDSDCGSQSI